MRPMRLCVWPACHAGVARFSLKNRIVFARVTLMENMDGDVQVGMAGIEAGMAGIQVGIQVGI